jgi:hypothetical protein
VVVSLLCGILVLVLFVRAGVWFGRAAPPSLSPGAFVHLSHVAHPPSAPSRTFIHGSKLPGTQLGAEGPWPQGHAGIERFTHERYDQQQLVGRVTPVSGFQPQSNALGRMRGRCGAAGCCCACSGAGRAATAVIAAEAAVVTRPGCRPRVCFPWQLCPGFAHLLVHGYHDGTACRVHQKPPHIAASSLVYSR